jgi:hypothetical protein
MRIAFLGKAEPRAARPEFPSPRVTEAYWLTVAAQEGVNVQPVFDDEKPGCGAAN